jgi:hypothetical protein
LCSLTPFSVFWSPFLTGPRRQTQEGDFPCD